MLSITSVLREYSQMHSFEPLARSMYPSLLRAFSAINNLDVHLDQNKAEIIRLLHVCATLYPSVLDLVSEDSASILIDNRIVVRGTKDAQSYNASILPLFYRLILSLCKHNNSHAIIAMRHSCIDWAIRTFIVCGDYQYREISLAVFEIVEYCITQAECPQQVRLVCSCVCVCVCVWRACACVRACLLVCVCVRACVRACVSTQCVCRHTHHRHTHHTRICCIYTQTCINIRVYTCV
jgi:hypothetical protein